MKKFVATIVVLIALLLGFYALVQYAGLDPEKLFSKSSEKVEAYGTVSPEKLQQLYDSLEIISFITRKETDERALKNLKETQKNLWERILLIRNAISKAEAPKSIKEEELDLVDTVIKWISIIAAILLVIIIFLIIMITRRAKEVEKVTERLKTLQAEPAPPPLSGLDQTVFSTRFRQPPLPQVKPAEMRQTTDVEPPRPVLRKTAKQRVTEAVKKMAEALESIRKYGTGKMQSANNTGPVAVNERLTKTKIRTQSPNNTRITPPADETTYDRMARERKQILDYAKQGRTYGEIAKWMSLPRDQVETVIRLAREKGEL